MDRDRAEPKADADDSSHVGVGDLVWHDGHTPMIHATSKQERKDPVLAFLGCRASYVRSGLGIKSANNEHA
jgi:hypothetical protein